MKKKKTLFFSILTRTVPLTMLQLLPFGWEVLGRGLAVEGVNNMVHLYYIVLLYRILYCINTQISISYYFENV